MNAALHYLGIDVAKATITCTLINADRSVRADTCTVTNATEGFVQLLTMLSAAEVRPTDTMICVESTGAYSLPVCRFFVEHGWNVAHLDAHKVQRAAEQYRHKTDPADSRMIAEYGSRFPDRTEAYTLPLPEVARLQTILKTRDQFVVARTAMTNRLHILAGPRQAHACEQERVKDMITMLSREIDRCIEDIRAHVRAHDHLEALWRVLCTMPGVGPITAAALLVATNAGTRFLNPRKLAGYCGISPLKRDSGTSVHAPARSRGFGPSLLRRQLYLGAWAQVRKNGPFHRYYLRKQEEGKKKILILNNVANKALRIICAMMRDLAPYEPKHRSVHPALHG